MLSLASNLRRLACFAIVCATLCLSACEGNASRPHDYQIVVSGSATPVAVEFAGSYTIIENGNEVIHDMAGSGSFTTSFQSTLLKRVRVQRKLGTGLISLTIYRDGYVIFESPPTNLPAPILYTRTTQ